MQVYEKELKETFFAGSKPGMVDYMIWPWFERFFILKEHGFVLNDDDKLPKLAAWVAAMEADPTVKNVRVPTATMTKFLIDVQKGHVDYDVE